MYSWCIGSSPFFQPRFSQVDQADFFKFKQLPSTITRPEGLGNATGTCLHGLHVARSLGGEGITMKRAWTTAIVFAKGQP